jgi:ABC-type transporter Mla subunit MlaD
MNSSQIKRIIRQVLQENYGLVNEDLRYEAEAKMIEFQKALGDINAHIDQLGALSEKLKSLMGDYYGVDERVTREVRKVDRAIKDLAGARDSLANRRMGIFNPSGIDTGFRN